MLSVEHNMEGQPHQNMTERLVVLWLYLSQSRE